MQELFEIAHCNALFSGIEANEFSSMLSCVEGTLKDYGRGELLLQAGDPVLWVGLVIRGSVQVLRQDSDGRHSLMAQLGPGQLFGEVFACAGVQHSPVMVQACQACRILRLNYRKIISTCPSACPFHQKLIGNMLSLLAEKNLMLHQKLELLSKRTTRQRLLAYFDQIRQGASMFTLPLSREDLAAYLCVDRSAMSAELSKMQSDGLIRYQKNQVQLL